MKHLLKVYEYLGRTSHYQITYGKACFPTLCKLIGDHSQFKTEILDLTTLISMVDSSHGGERPMAGDVQIIAAAPTGWRANRHPITPLNVAQGEYMIATKATTEIICHRGIMEPLPFQQATAQVEAVRMDLWTQS